MMRNLLSVTGVVILVGAVGAAELKSGPQPGDTVPGPFHPLNINGLYAGKEACLYCMAGDSPVVAIFARNPDDAALKKLISAVEDATTRHAKAELTGFVVFCGERDKLGGKLKDLAEKARLQNVVLAIEAKEGPAKYDINPDANITVLLYKERIVKSNFTFGPGKLTEKDVEKVKTEIGKLVK